MLIVNLINQNRGLFIYFRVSEVLRVIRVSQQGHAPHWPLLVVHGHQLGHQVTQWCAISTKLLRLDLIKHGKLHLFFNNIQLFYIGIKLNFLCN